MISEGVLKDQDQLPANASSVLSKIINFENARKRRFPGQSNFSALCLPQDGPRREGDTSVPVM